MNDFSMITQDPTDRITQSTLLTAMDALSQTTIGLLHAYDYENYGHCALSSDHTARRDSSQLN